MTKRNNEVQNQNGEKTPSVFRSWDRSHSKSHQFGDLDDDRGWGRKLTDTAAQDEGRDFTDHQVLDLFYFINKSKRTMLKYIKHVLMDDMMTAIYCISAAAVKNESKI